MTEIMSARLSSPPPRPPTVHPAVAWNELNDRLAVLSAQRSKLVNLLEVLGFTVRGVGEGEDGWADKIAQIENLVLDEVMREEMPAAAAAAATTTSLPLPASPQSKKAPWPEKKKKLAAGPPQPVGLKRPLQDPEEKTKKSAAKLEPLSVPGSAIQNFLP